MENFLNQLKQRQIFKVAIIYVVSAWPLMGVADIVVTALGLPESVITILLQVFLIGLPISLIFAWLINFSSEGLVRVDPSSDEQGELGSTYKEAILVGFRTTVWDCILLTVSSSLQGGWRLWGDIV